MGRWGTYTLNDFLLFSPEVYDRLFERSNAAAWPLPLIMTALGASIAMLLWRGSSGQARPAAALLAVSWLWVAWYFHLRHYAAINWAAPWFAVLFAIEAGLLIGAALKGGRLAVASTSPLDRWFGRAMTGLGVFGYPLVNPLLGQGWCRTEWFGMAPDPTAIATLGLFLTMGCQVPWLLWIGPVAWCLITGATLWILQAPHAFIPPLAGVLALALAVRSRFSKTVECRLD